MKNKKYGKLLKPLLAVTLIISTGFLIFQIPKYRRYSDKENVKNTVFKNLDILNENYDNALEFEGVKTKEYWRMNSKELIVNFSSKEYGIVPSSIYTGFYFTKVDEPTGFEGNTYPLTKLDKGWEWKEEAGDNWYYTEKIGECWYYYEAGF